MAIVDDCAEDAEALAHMVRTLAAAPGAEAETGCEVRVFPAVAALSACLDEGYVPDIAFVDIVLEPQAAHCASTGIDAVEKLFGAGSPTQVIYVSGYDEFHTQVYRTPHAAYLCKPFAEKDVVLAIGIALNARERFLEKPLNLRVKGVERIVHPADIVYLESSLHTLRIHTAREVIETYGKLADALVELPHRFVRTHQSFAVNLDAVKSLDAGAVELANGESVPVSRRMRASVRAALFEHIRTERS